MRLFVVELKGQPVAVLNADSKLEAEEFGASLKSNGEAGDEQTPVVVVREPQAAEVAAWRSAWQAERREGRMMDEDRMCCWLVRSGLHDS
jgi:hypothetical protein